MITIKVRGNEKTVPEGKSLEELSREYNWIFHEEVVLIYNGRHTAPEDLSVIYPKDGDDIDFFFFLGGGC